MPNLSFNSIPQNLAVPLFYAEFSTQATNQNLSPQWTCLIGQTITAATSQLTYISSYASAVALFGVNSMLAEMVNHYRAVDPTGTLYVIPLADNGSGVAATGTIAISGTATSAGVLSLYINGTSVPVAVPSGMTASQAGAAVVAAIGAVTTGMPVSAVNSTGTVTLTALNKGTLGNDIDVRLNFYGLPNNEVTPPGLTVTITAMASGATNPVLTGIGALLADQPFDYIVSPYNDATSTTAMSGVMNAISGRWAYNRQSYGHVFSAKCGGRGTSYSTQAAALITAGAALNDPHLTMVGYIDNPNSPQAIASEFAAAVAVSTRADPARPTQTLQLPGILPPSVAFQFAFADKQALLVGGVAILHAGAGGVVTIERAVTTYQFNSFGTPDQSYRDCETLFTLMAVIRTLKAAITQKYPRAKLASNGTNVGFGSNIVTPNSVRAEIIAQYAAMINSGLVDDPGDFAAGLLVQQNSNDPTRLDVLFDPYIIPGLRIVAVETQFNLIAPNTQTPVAP